MRSRLRKKRRDSELGTPFLMTSEAAIESDEWQMPKFSKNFGRISPQKVTAFEKRAGLKLPPDYKRFLTTTNGGVPRPAVFTVPRCGDVLIDFLYGLRGEPKRLDLEQEQVYAQELDPLPAGFLVIGKDPGGNALLLDTTSGGSIYYWDRVAFYAGTTPEGNTYPVAATFSEFLASLHKIDPTGA